MTQSEMFHDDIYSALRSAVEIMGGAKRVGAAMWPTKPVIEAEKRLLNSLNPDHPQKLGVDELMVVLVMARQAGAHTVMEYLGMALDYDVRPITPEQKQANALEQFKACKAQVAAMARLFDLKVVE